MTPRQKEFCRHYLAGLPAAQAALAAGYAKSTAERNAAAILMNEHITAKLARMRAAREQPYRAFIEKSTERFMHTASYVSDERLTCTVSREMRAWFKLSAHLGPSQQELDELDALLTPVDATLPVINRMDIQTPDNQSTDSEIKPDSELHDFSPEEHDALEDGTPAFDLRQSPRKPIPPKKEPIEIRVVNALSKTPEQPRDHYGRLIPQPHYPMQE